MTAEMQEQAPVQGNDKEINFAKVRQQLEAERSARMQYERELSEQKQMIAELQRSRAPVLDDDDDDSEPYVDHKRLEKKFSTFEKRMDEKIDKRAEEKARVMVEGERRNTWLKEHPDFNDVLQHAETFANKDPEYAESILRMPDEFERQKLAYKAIKGMGLTEKPKPESTIQQKIDANRRNAYYTPPSGGTPAYSGGGDYSPSGQKNAYDVMLQLKNRLRLG